MNVKTMNLWQLFNKVRPFVEALQTIGHRHPDSDFDWSINRSG
jgi:hypothetical protein